MGSDHTELVELLNSVGPRLHALFIRVTLRPDVAEELMQELFINLSGSRGFARAASREAYAYRAAMNLAFGWRRAQSRRPPSVPLDNDHASDTPTPLATLLANEQVQRVLDSLDRLSPAQREVMVMRYIQQESYETIARHLGRKPHRLRGICHKAIRSLRRLMGEDDHENRSEEIHYADQE